jgi:hypothetical protein
MHLEAPHRGTSLSLLLNFYRKNINITLNICLGFGLVVVLGVMLLSLLILGVLSL